MILFFWEWAIFCRRFFAVSFRETSFWIFDQEFQVPKMEVLNLIRLFLGWVFPYISLTYIFYRWGFLRCRSLPEMFGDYSTELFWISNYRGLAQQKKYLGFRSRWVGFDVSSRWAPYQLKIELWPLSMAEHVWITGVTTRFWVDLQLVGAHLVGFISLGADYPTQSGKTPKWP